MKKNPYEVPLSLFVWVATIPRTPTEGTQPLTAQPIIQVENLTKRFNDLIAVDDVSFTVHTGEILGLLGPNGAGKTTVIQLLLGLTTPTAGAVSLFGQDVQQHRRAILQRVNFASAYVALPSNLTVRENLTVFARLYGVRKAQTKIHALLEIFEIAQVYTQLTGALSSGQLTRIHLCKALLNDPELLFLDEPTASLDPDIAAKVRATLQQLQQERRITMIYTSHNMREIETMCDRLIFLSHGRIITQGTPQDVLTRAQLDSLETMFITIARDGALHDMTDAGEGM
jgi:ABC-2 type transport system ATP-binding protein